MITREGSPKQKFSLAVDAATSTSEPTDDTETKLSDSAFQIIVAATGKSRF